MDSLFSMPFDKPLKGVGAVRTWSGMICAAVLCRAMGWLETGTGGAEKGECVPDAWDGKTAFEIKGVSLRKKSGKSVIYKFRMEKEEQAYPKMVYAFVGHPPLNTPKTLAELHRKLSDTAFDVVLVPAVTVYDYIRRFCELKPVKSWKVNAPEYQGVGYNREGYSDGYYCPNVALWFNSAEGPYIRKTMHEGLEFKINLYIYEADKTEVRNETLPKGTGQKLKERKMCDA